MEPNYSMDYCAARLDIALNIFGDPSARLSSKNREKVQTLFERYFTFRDDPNYDCVLADRIRRHVLNERTETFKLEEQLT